MTFKKTTKTDKTVAVTKRIEIIKREVKSNTDLFIFLTGLAGVKNISKNVQFAGKSPTSLIVPLYGTNGCKVYSGLCIRRMFSSNDNKIVLEPKGVRVTSNSKINIESICRLLSKVFKVSAIRYDESNLFNVLVKIGDTTDQTIRYDEEFTKQMVKHDMVKKYIEVYNKLVDQRADANRRYQRALTERQQAVNSASYWSSQYDDIQIKLESHIKYGKDNGLQ